MSGRVTPNRPCSASSRLSWSPKWERNDRCAVSYCGCWESPSRLSFSSTSSTSSNRGGAALTFLPYAGEKGSRASTLSSFHRLKCRRTRGGPTGSPDRGAGHCRILFGREVLLPLALAILLSFVLTLPLLFLRRLKVPRVIGVSMVVTLRLWSWRH